MDSITFQQQLGMMGGMGLLPVLAILWGLFVTLFWMICAWRAMRAHESLAQAVRELANRGE